MAGSKNGKKGTSESKRRKTSTPVWLPKIVHPSSNEVLCRLYSSSSSRISQIAAESVSETSRASEANPNPTDNDGHEEATLTSQTHIPMDNSPPNDDTKDLEKDDSLSTDVKSSHKNDPSSISIEAGSLIRFVKGKHGYTQRLIEEECGVKLIFPSSKEQTCIVVESMSMDSVFKASEKIREILEEAAKSPKLDYSHFVSLPLAIHGELVEKFAAFQNSILGECDPSMDNNLSISSDDNCSDGEENMESPSNEAKIAVNLKVLEEDQHVKVELGEKSAKQLLSVPVSDLGIDRSIFIKPKTLHLTVLMLKLYNKERLSLAAEVLQKISSEVKDALNNRPIFIKLKGLACMRGSPGKARVVYSPVEEIGGEGRLLRACRVIIDAYLEAGLIDKEDAKQTLKLHATLMNARHRKRKKKRVHKFDSFDARTIFKKYGSEEWGEYLIREAHLSQRFKFNEDGYYHCCSSIPFPEPMQVE